MKKVKDYHENLQKTQPALAKTLAPIVARMLPPLQAAIDKFNERSKKHALKRKRQAQS